VRVADHETVRDPLLGALAATLGDGWDVPTREAWVTAYNLVAETMLEGAASARPIGA
jgi:hemoglobin-like flavoprotein